VALVAMLTTPMVVPVIVTAVAIYFGFSFVGLNNTLTGLILAHTVLSVPYVLLTVLATLTTFDRNLLKAAATCGAPPHVAFTRVVLPLIAPGVATGALFAFATSFDELVVAIFVSSPGQFTLPRQMFAGLREFLSPTIAAAAVLLIVCSVLLLAANEMLRARARGRTIAADPAEPN
jgi:putative spermidine/putrescine transport system permease protein